MGTGSAAQTVAYACRAAGWNVAVTDSDPFGGTCQLRGCDPKKVLVGVAELVDWSLVDDDASVRSMLATMFMADGWGVVEAEDGDEGLRVVRELSPWAAVIDLQMPGLGGLQLTRVLR